jgi:putative membrane protein|nr:SHOCT domain-containing protein [Pseudonocardia lacus]
MRHWIDGMPGWGNVIMMTGTLVFWAVILLIVVAAALRLPREDGSRGGRRDRRPDAERMLAERFARGGIDEAEYRARLDVLRHGTAGTTGPRT